MKILLCLLSDQHVPNLLSIHHFCPDRLVLVESEQMKGKSKALLAALKTGGDNDVLDYADRCSIVPLECVNSLQYVLDLLQREMARFPDADWLVNLTGGNKLMALAAFQCFAVRKAQ